MHLTIEKKACQNHTDTEVCWEFIDTLGLIEYKEKFVAAGIETMEEMLAKVDDAFLTELGLKLLHKMKFLKHIASVRKEMKRRARKQRKNAAKDTPATETTLITVQFKWGRVGSYNCTIPVEIGDAVIVGEEKEGYNLGIVGGIAVDVKGRAVPSVQRVATEEEVKSWNSLLAASEHDAITFLSSHPGLQNSSPKHVEYHLSGKHVTIHICTRVTPAEEKIYASVFPSITPRYVLYRSDVEEANLRDTQAASLGEDEAAKKSFNSTSANLSTGSVSFSESSCYEDDDEDEGLEFASAWF